MKKILLYGDYSRVHWTLAQGLRELGIDAKVASTGDEWKNYERDINIGTKTNFDKIKILYSHLFSSNFRNYDVVQLINYGIFFKRFNLTYKILNRLKKNNDKIIMGAFGDDCYWVKACLNKVFDYSFLGLNQNNEEIMTKETNAQNVIIIHNTPSSYKLNRYVANVSDSIIAGTYDYWLPYHKSEFSNKLRFIPFPINTDEILYQPNILKNNKIVFLIGVQKNRYFWKGLDWVCPVLNEFKERYSNDIELCFVENVPYDEYIKIMNRANVIVDQVYSIGQGMNALTALAKGKIVMTGAEDTQYSLIEELKNRPIINIKPDKAQIKNQLELILDSRNIFESWGGKCRKYIEVHHNYVSIAKQYCQAWNI
jgi:hypothetical protein